MLAYFLYDALSVVTSAHVTPVSVLNKTLSPTSPSMCRVWLLSVMASTLVALSTKVLPTPEALALRSTASILLSTTRLLPLVKSVLT